MLCAHPPGRAMISEGRAAQARWIFLGRTFLWCVKTPPLFTSSKGHHPSPACPTFPSKKGNLGFEGRLDSRGARVRAWREGYFSVLRAAKARGFLRRQAEDQADAATAYRPG